ncbi:MAG: neutral/alkaline non-lysosomal ceramidase N-terminal domain-containing protein [Clostridia bacterium]|nr:neutral/alkaline non-lysosomal ceramidase N-terminal domain-containing protein [Clostridia bacterium]
MANNLKVGYARVNITPPLGVNIAGYYKERIADGVLDELEACAVAVEAGGKTVILMTVDHCGLNKVFLTPWREEIAAKTGVDAEAIFIHSTHTHQGPALFANHPNPLNAEYGVFLNHRVVDVAVLALQDLKPAKMGIGVGEAKNVAFIRRYRMKDGSAKTNPGVNNPDIVSSIGDTDERVNVIRFDREGAETVVIGNFANHPDVVGGTKISADWPGMTRRIVEQAIENTKCIFFNGAQGDVNHVNVHPKAGDFNDMFNDFDGCSRGYGHARHIARVVTAAIMTVYDKVEWLEVDSLKYTQRIVDVEANKADPKDLPLAHKYVDLHNAGRDDEIPYKAMMLTTVVAAANRMVRLENGPDTFPMLFSAVAIGDVAFFGIPGEPFTGVGRGVKEAEGWKMILPCCNTNSKEGYFPMKDSYDEGGYEAGTSSFKAGTAEKIIEESHKILGELR